LPGFFLPLFAGFGLAFWVFDLPLLVSLFVGGTMTATSIGITVRVLADLKRQDSHEGQIVLGAAVLDDILGVVLPGLALRVLDGRRRERREYEQGADFHRGILRSRADRRALDFRGHKTIRRSK
jgi:Kef-type K+ transport system membrane component KefB